MLFERTDHMKYICTVLLQTKKMSLIPFERTGHVIYDCIVLYESKKTYINFDEKPSTFLVFKNGKKKTTFLEASM